MSGRYYSDEIVSKLSSLGVSFGVKPPKTPQDPEVFILESLRYYWDYNDIFFLIFSLLKHRLKDLIHVERLITRAHHSYLPSDHKVLLIALCNKLVDSGDRRFALAEKKLGDRKLKMLNPPEKEATSSLIKTWGVEQSLKPFGVEVRSFYDEQKKLLPITKIIERNAWLRIRSIVGPNYRADIIYLKTAGIAKTAYQASKIAGCSTSVATRIWKSLELVNNLEKLIA